MKILYLSQYFPPEVGATQERSLEMTDYLAHQGHEVTVLCNLPNHPVGRIASEYRHKWISWERLGNLQVIRTWVYTRPNKNKMVRAGFYTSFLCSSLWAGNQLPGPFDVVFATSPPPLVGLSGLWLSKRHRAKFIYEVRDLWLEMAQELGMVTSPAFSWGGQRLDNYLYRHAQRIIVVTAGIYEHLRQKGWQEKLELIPNGSNTNVYYDAGRALRKTLGWEDKFVVLYAGLLGLAQGMDDLCRLMYHFREDPSVLFVVIGDGPLRAFLERTKKQLPNLHLLGTVPRQRMAEYISAADCCLVPLKRRKLFLGAVPSKMFDYMACQRPVILSVDGEAHTILQNAQAGIYVPPEDIMAMAKAIRFLQANPQKAHAMGVAGRAYVEKHYTRRMAAQRLEKILSEMLE